MIERLPRTIKASRSSPEWEGKGQGEEDKREGERRGRDVEGKRGGRGKERGRRGELLTYYIYL